MRYRGGGVGHSTTRAATDFFKQDRHPNDQHCHSHQEEMNVDGEEDDKERETGEEVEGDDEADDRDREEEEEEEEEEEVQDDENDDNNDDGEESEVERLGFTEL